MRVISHPLRVLAWCQGRKNAELMILSLRRGGFEPAWHHVATAESLRTALSDARWDVIFVDERLSPVEVDEILKVVRAHDSDAAVILVTGSASDESFALRTGASVVKYLPRSDIANLPATARRELRERHRERSRRLAPGMGDGNGEAVDALRLSEERFRAFIDNNPACAWITDEEGRFLLVNATYYRTVRTSHKDLVGRSISEVFPAEYAARYLKSIRTVATENRVLATSEQAIRADGSLGSFLVYEFPVPTAGGTRAVGGIAVDVTEHKLTEEALRLRDRAISAATQGILITDPRQTDNPIIYMSPGFERLTGYTPAEVVGRNCRFLQGPETDAAARDRLRRAVRIGEACTVEMLNYRKDGTTFWNELSLSPVRDEGGQLIHFVGVQNDVTNRKRLEEQFRHSQKMEAIGRLAGTVAHDFNNLLTVINGSCEMLLKAVSPHDPTYGLLDSISQAGKRSTDLTRQLLMFSRQQPASPRVLDLNQVIRGTETMLRRLVGAHIDLTTSLAPQLGRVKIDPGLFEQTLMNLAANARDAMGGGGTLRIETRDIELDAKFCRKHAEAEPGPHVRISVSDTGAGMPHEIQSRVFEPFFTTKPVGEGTGLGLPIVHGIVKQFGGLVTIDSTLGMGTTFHVYLPHAAEAVASAITVAGSIHPHPA